MNISYRESWIAKKKYDEWKEKNPFPDRFMFDIVDDSNPSNLLWKENVPVNKTGSSSRFIRGVRYYRAEQNRAGKADEITIHLYSSLCSDLFPEHIYDFYDKETNSMILSTVDLKDNPILDDVAKFLDEKKQNQIFKIASYKQSWIAKKKYDEWKSNNPASSWEIISLGSGWIDEFGKTSKYGLRIFKYRFMVAKNKNELLISSEGEWGCANHIFFYREDMNACLAIDISHTRNEEYENKVKAKADELLLDPDNMPNNIMI